jgi:hypothetical protein
MATKSKVIEGIELPMATEFQPTSIMTSRPIKKSASIREADNGFIVHVDAGVFSEEWVFLTLPKAIKAIIAFLNTTEDEAE